MRVCILALFVSVASAASFAPLYKSDNPIPNSYLVKIKDGQNIDQFVKKLAPLGMAVTHRYKKAFNGVAVNAQTKSIASLQRMPEVEYIEEDGVFHASVEWGMDRTDERYLPLDGRADFYGDGAGCHIYIVDTGLRHSHQEFTGRASYFWDFDEANQGEDCHCHGTHVGAIAAGATVGIAPAANIYSVRVLNCAGMGVVSYFIEGCEAIIEYGSRPGVVSLSHSGGVSRAMDIAVEALISAGFTVCTAAGNVGGDACNSSPARVERAITVGATDSLDNRAGYSNYGTCVDIFAPGSNIKSPLCTCDSCYATLSGTSMACPHVTGVAAVHLGARSCSSNDACKTRILNDATEGVVNDPGYGSPDRLLYLD